jgi:hypothetical protein
MRQKTNKRIRELDGEIKRLRSLLKKCKCGSSSQDMIIIDEEEIEYNNKPIQPCPHCATGLMSEIEIIGRSYLKCSSCGRTKKV